MKTFYKRILAVKDVSSDEFPQGLSIVLMIFFLLFGAASLLILL
jgi:hypothetical protein